MRLKNLLSDVGERFKPTSYVDYHEAPDEPEGPYRARVTAALDLGPAGVEVCEREIVRGEMQKVWSIRWFTWAGLLP